MRFIRNRKTAPTPTNTNQHFYKLLIMNIIIIIIVLRKCWSKLVFVGRCWWGKKQNQHLLVRFFGLSVSFSMVLVVLVVLVQKIGLF